MKCKCLTCKMQRIKKEAKSVVTYFHDVFFCRWGKYRRLNVNAPNPYQKLKRHRNAFKVCFLVFENNNPQRRFQIKKWCIDLQHPILHFRNCFSIGPNSVWCCLLTWLRKYVHTSSLIILPKNHLTTAEIYFKMGIYNKHYIDWSL